MRLLALAGGLVVAAVVALMVLVGLAARDLVEDDDPIYRLTGI